MKTINLYKRLERARWLALTALMVGCQVAVSQTSSVAPIGTLGGTYSNPYGINSLGQVVGSSQLPGDVTEHAFLFSGGTLLDLQTLGGNFSVGYSINKNGQVVGYSELIPGSPQTHAFLFSGGSMYDLQTLGGSSSSALAINDAGQIIGNSATASEETHAFLYQGGHMTDLGTLGGTYSAAIALNGVGGVAGESSLASGQTHAFVWNGTMSDLGTLGGSYSTPYDINDAGWVVGYSYTASDAGISAFLWNGTALVDLGNLGGAFSAAYRVNNKGQVSGDAYTAGWSQHAFLYAEGTMADLGHLGGDYSSMYDMNNSGQIVGVSMDANYNIIPFLWEEGAMVDLNSLLPTNSGWVLQTAFQISDGGQITGYGLYQGRDDCYVLSLNETQNQPPLAEAGPDQVVECSGAQTVVTLDGTGSQDPDGDAITYEWSYNGTVLGTSAVLPVAFGLGAYQVSLKVQDPSGAFSEDVVNINVVDTTPPVAVCPAPSSVPADNNCQAVLGDLRGGVSAVDGCTPANSLAIAQSPEPGSLIGLGENLVVFTVTDSAGNQSTCSTVITVQDVTPPVINSILADPSILSPIKKQLVPVTLTVSATDNCDAAPVSKIISIESSQPETGPGDKTILDWEITGDLTANLRAENSRGQIRVYTLTIQCTDASGNITIGTVNVPDAKK